VVVVDFSLYKLAGLWYNRSGSFIMEIQLLEIQSYLDNIKNGSITEIRLPRMEMSLRGASPAVS
jgi:hypothetical protein